MPRYKSMIPRLLLLLTVNLVSCLSCVCSAAQDIQSLKSGVVRVVNPMQKAQGTGFIIHISEDRTQLFVLTAAHVVQDTDQPEIYIFNKSNALKGKVLNREIDELKGLAVLVVTSTPAVISGLSALPLGQSSSIQGGRQATLSDIQVKPSYRP